VPASGTAVSDAPEPADVVAGPFTTLEEALDAVPLPPVPKGNAVIEGHVRDGDGAPVAGADVWCWPTVERIRDGDVVGRVRRLLVHRHWWSAGTVAKTDAAGRYRLEGLARLRYELRARHPHYGLRGPRGPSTVTPDAQVDYVATPRVRLPIDVRMPDGTPAARATIETWGDRTNGHHGWRRGRRDLDLAPGTWRLRATLEGPPTYRSEAVTVEARHGEFPDPVTLRLRSTTGLFGEVRFDGTPRGVARVALQRRTGDREPRRAQLDRGVQKVVSDGRYRCTVVEPGPYWAALCLGPGEPVEVRAVEIGPEPQRLDFRVDGTGDGFFTLRVVDGAGRPVRGARIGSGFAATPFALETRPGTYRLPAYPEGSRTLHVSKRDVGRAQVTIDFPVRGATEVQLATR